MSGEGMDKEKEKEKDSKSEEEKIVNKRVAGERRRSGETTATVEERECKRLKQIDHLPAAEDIKREDYPSKNAYKKALKDLRKLKQKLLNKEQVKNERKAKQQERLEKRRKAKDSLSEDEVKAIKKRAKDNYNEKKQVKEEKRKRLLDAQTSAPTVVIDLEFGKYMTDTEMRSLVHQLMYCYSSNGKSERPLHIMLSGLSDPVGKYIKETNGYKNWVMTMEDGSYLDALPDRRDDLVYLTADSENLVESIDPSKVYIIGGIVDRNRHKLLCQKKAEEQGIATGRLPIREHVNLQSSTVLTTNQVYDIILKFHECKDWATALKAVIPTRKLKKEPSNQK